MKNFKTTITALITPFKNGKVDWQGLESLVKHQLQGGVGGFVINGTTAESPTLDGSEVEEIFKRVRAIVSAKTPLILGTGSNCTKKTIEASQKAEALGADAVLVVVPYYNKPPQRGLVAHFEAVANAIKIPVILYNVPSRTITALSLSSIEQLSKHKNIVGIKEASGNIDFAKEIIAVCGKDFLMLSGDDGTYPEFLLAGGHGVISVASHIIPKAFSQLLQEPTSNEHYKKYLRLIGLLFAEANPIPVKKALHLMGVISSGELRLPLCELEESLTRDLSLELEKAGLL
jgi:4-hydroxy-tetrahydrodipicolinate synthase